MRKLLNVAISLTILLVYVDNFRPHPDPFEYRRLVGRLLCLTTTRPGPCHVVYILRLQKFSGSRMIMLLLNQKPLLCQMHLYKLSLVKEPRKQFRQYLVSKNLSVLFLNNVHASMMKNTLKYLLSLPPDEGFCMRNKSEMLQLLQSLTQLISNYCDADAKHDSATSELSKAAAATATAKAIDLEAHVREFREMDKEYKYLCNQLASLEEEKREVEEKINCIKIQIANSTARGERVVKRKIELFLEVSGMKEERDHFRNQLPRLKAEKECAKLAQANFEAEWSKLPDQFIQNTCFNVWI